MSYHMTNSSHAIDHFLCMLRYMCCVECCWKSRLTPAVCVLEGAATRRGGVLSCGDRTPPCRAERSAWIRAVYPGWTHGMLAHFMVRLYIAVVCKWQPTVISYSEALADRIVSRYFVWYRIVSIVFSYGWWLYHAITSPSIRVRINMPS